MKILIFSAIPVVYTLITVLYSMRMHQINHNFYLESMGFIDEFFELLWSAEPTGNSEKIANMIAKGTIVRMLKDSHYLNSVIAKFSDIGKNILLKIIKVMYFGINTSHPNMTLINFERCFVGLPRRFWVNKLITTHRHISAIETFGTFILHCIVDPSRYPIQFVSLRRCDLTLNFRKLWDRFRKGKLALPMPELILKLSTQLP